MDGPPQAETPAERASAQTDSGPLGSVSRAGSGSLSAYGTCAPFSLRAGTKAKGILTLAVHMPHRLLKRIIWTSLAAAVGIVAMVYFGYRQLSPLTPATVFPKAGLEELVVEGIHQTATREGRTEWSLDAGTAQYRLSEKKILLTDLFVTFFTRNDQKVYLTARHGSVMTDSHDMEAYGGVVVYNDAYHLETEQMKYSHGLRMITSDAPVKITGPTGDLMGDSLELDLNNNRLVLRGHVRGTLVAGQTP